MPKMLTPKRLERIKSTAHARQQGVVVLEDIHDPHNAAAVLRTCDAFGIQKVYFIQAPSRIILNPARNIGLFNHAAADSKVFRKVPGFIFEKTKRITDLFFENYVPVVSETFSIRFGYLFRQSNRHSLKSGKVLFKGRLGKVVLEPFAKHDFQIFV